MSVNTLQFYTNASDSTVKYDSESTYGVVTLEADAVQQEVQNVTTQTWYGENGEEAYIPSGGVNFKAYDYTFTLGVKENDDDDAITRKDLFISAIKSIIWGKIYQPYTHQELKSAYLSKVEDDDVTDEFVTFKCTFHVLKP